MEKVTVIVPVYNVEKFLDDCVDSLRQQTYRNLEIILVDDGSTDKSGRMCDDFAKEDIRIKVIHKKNGGLSDARNKGIAYASGDWIILVDSDDFIHPELVSECLATAKSKDADIVTYAMIRVDENVAYFDCKRDFARRKFEEKGNNGSKNLNVFSGRDMFYQFMKNGMGDVVACNKFYKGSLLKKIRYPKGRYHEDEFVIADVYLGADKVVVTEQAWYYYRMREGSITHNKNLKNRYDTIFAYANRCIKTKFDKQLHEMAVRQYLLYHITLYSCETDKEKKRIILKSFRKRYDYCMYKNEYWKTQIVLILFFFFPSFVVGFLIEEQ